MSNVSVGNQRKPRIALVVPDLSVRSGIPALIIFLHRILSESNRFEFEIITLSSSVRDPNSTRITEPGTWFKKITETNEVWEGLPHRHVGAKFTELEFQRYQPRPLLTEILDTFDIVQVVAGCPPLGLVAKHSKRKVALLIATLTGSERVSLLNRVRGIRRMWIGFMTRINIALEKPAIRRADIVFVINRLLHKNLREQYGDKIAFAPPGTDMEFYHPSNYREDGYLLSVGRFGDARKNAQLLFDAYALLRKKISNAPRLVLAGETAPVAADMEHAEALGLTPYLDIHLSVSLENLRTLYQNASLFLLSSNEEGLGLVIAEAMGCGVPVISTNCGGPETLVVEGETGFLTPVGDAVTMSERIRELLDDVETRKRMGANARRRAVELFSLEATGKVFLDHYESLLGNNRNSHRTQDNE